MSLSSNVSAAGDYVKFGFPMAYTATVLSWGALDQEAGYTAASTYLSACHCAYCTHYIIVVSLYNTVSDARHICVCYYYKRCYSSAAKRFPTLWDNDCGTISVCYNVDGNVFNEFSPCDFHY